MSARRRALVGAVVFAVLVGTAWAPDAIARTFGWHATPVAPADGPGFEATPYPLRITAKSMHLLDAQALDYQRVALVGGTLSPPDTIYARARAVTIEGLHVVQSRAGYDFDIVDYGTTVIGNEQSAGILWLVFRKADVCVRPETLSTLVTSYAGVLGGRLDELLRAVADAFAPFVAGPLASVGPCIPVGAFLPLAAVLVKNGLPLPGDVPIANVEADAYVIKAESPLQDAFVLERGVIRVANK